MRILFVAAAITLFSTSAFAQAGNVCTMAWVAMQCENTTYHTNCERSRSCRQSVVEQWMRRGGCSPANADTWGDRVARDCGECNRQYCR
ncbi:MAG TPA: hypothetical protein VNR39_11375 [Pseudolabrys sp.]|nr:hypothetical protein [Pseudolabrys sp.]